MRRFCMFFLSLVLAMQAWAAERTVVQDGLRFFPTGGDGEPYVAKVMGADEDEGISYAELTTVTIPSTINYEGNVYNVTAIDDNAFYGCGNLASIVISEGVVSIGSEAFRECHNLTSVTLPSTLEAIGYKAFNECAFSSITIPASVKTISENAFDNCRNMMSISIPATVETMGWSVFEACDNNLTIFCSAAEKPDGWADGWNSGRTVIWNASSVSIIISGDYILTISDADNNCVAITKYIGNGTDVTVPQPITDNGTDYTITEIGEKAFYATGVESVALPEGLTTIGQQAFYACQNLSTVTLPQSLRTVNDYAFRSTAISEITIPDGVTTISGGAFSGVQTVYYHGSADGAPWGAGFLNPTVENGFLFADDTKTTISKYVGTDSEIVIPQGVLRIDNSAFSGNNDITSVVMNSELESIGESAFSFCQNLSSVSLPEGLTTIGYDAFHNCKSLFSITVPDGVESIEWAFSQGVQIVYYHGSADGAPWGAEFLNPTVENGFLFADDTKTTISKYIGTETAIVIPDGVTKIAEGAFSNTENITSVVIPNSITEIGGNDPFGYGNINYTEYGNSCYLGNTENLYLVLVKVSSYGAESYEIHPNTKLICNGAFLYTNLSSLTVPSSVTYIGNSAFSGVQTVYYHGSADGAPWGAEFLNPTVENGFLFADDTKTTISKYEGTDSEIVIPQGVLRIDNNAFSGNNDITSVVMNSELESIGQNAFSFCQNLRSVSLPDGLKSIEYDAFHNCKSLFSITVPDGVENVDCPFSQGVQNVVYNGELNGSSWGARFLNATIDGDFLYTDAAKTILGGYSGTTAEITIPQGVKEISDQTFRECHNLTIVRIPSSVETIGNNVFDDCWNLTAIICDFDSQPDNWSWDWNGGHTVIWNTTTFSVNIAINNPDFGSVEGYQEGREYHYGDVLELTAVPNHGCYFEGWRDNYDGWGNKVSDNPYTIVVTSDLSLTAEFYGQSPVSISVRSKNTFLGTVSGFNPDESYYIGDVLTLSVTTVEQSQFLQWSDGNTDNPRTITIDGDLNLVAELADPLYLSDNSGWIAIGAYYELTKDDAGNTTQVDLSFSNPNNRYDAQFVTPSLKNLGSKGDAFELSFDIKYSGEWDYGQFRIVAGKTFPYDADYDQGNNTQIVDEYGDSRGWGDYDEFYVNKGDWTRVNYRQYLGAEGADSVRLEFDLGYVPGTISIRNITLKVAGNVVDKWFNTPIVAGPFTGSPIALPGVIEFENFDNGENGASYYDTDEGNHGDDYGYRYDVDADIDRTDFGYGLGWTAQGEWLNYTVTVEEEQVMQWSAKITSFATDAGAKISIYKDDVNVTGEITAPCTDSWYRYGIVTGQTQVPLPAGTYQLKLYFETSDVNVDNIIFGNAIVNATAVGGSVSGIGAYNNGDVATLTATPAENYKFKQWNDGNTDNPRQVTVSGNMVFEAEFEELQYVGWSNEPNTWFVDGNMLSIAPVEDNTVVINVSESGNPWDAQFCTILWGLDGQAAGNDFQLDFDVKWNSFYESDNSTIYILTGKNAGYHDEYQWDETENTELVNVEGSNSGIHNADYQISNGQWRHITWGGKIGEKGADFIGIQINLSLPEDEGDNRGTFFFKNLNIRINDNLVKSDFVVPEQGGNTATISLARAPLAGEPESGTVAGGGTYNIGETITITATPNLGFRFVEWSDGNPNAERQIVVTENLQLTAYFLWMPYTITYNLDGGNTDNWDFTYESFTIESEFTIPYPEKEGYTFAGWIGTDLSQPTMDVAITKGSIGNREYTATWAARQFTISFDTDGGSAVSSITANYGDNVIVPSDPVKTGFEFSGWNPAVPATMPANDLVCTAMWTESGYTKYTVQHYQQNIDNDEYTLFETDSTKTGKTNATTNVAGNNYVGFSIERIENATITADESAVAKIYYKRNNYTLTYNADGGQLSGDYSSGSIRYGAEITAPADPTRTGYTFSAWDKQIPATMPAENLTIKALWNINSYVVTAKVNNSNFGSVTGSGSYNYGSTATISAIAADGYEFIGWTDGETVATRTITVESDVELTARFRKIFIAEREVNNLKFVVDTTTFTAELIGFMSGIKFASVSSTIVSDGLQYTVNSIGNGAFSGSSITDFAIPYSVKNIGSEAFANCTNALSITIPDAVETIGANAFLNVKNIVYHGNAAGSPWGALTINGSFADNFIYTDSALTVYTGTEAAVVIPDSISSIGQSAFAGNTAVESVVIPETVTEIGAGAFSGCENLKSVEIPNTVTEIGNETFAGCTSLDSVQIPESVEQIGVGAFSGCTSLTNIEIPVSVTVIGAGAFSGCENLKSIEIPNTVTEIGNETFAGCTSLDSVQIPNTVTEIGSNAFSSCTSLSAIAIPASVTTIGNGAFAFCTTLVTVQIGNADSVSAKNSFKTITTLADDNLAIGERAFYGCDGLKSVYIPLNVTAIGDSAFAGCKNLTIYCEAEQMPDGWAANWNPDGCTVVWNYKALAEENQGNENQGNENQGGNEQGNENQENTTAIDEDAVGEISIYAYGNTIVVENATSEIYIYNAMGELVDRMAANADRVEIQIDMTGVYIVKTGNTAKRVMIN